MILVTGAAGKTGLAIIQALAKAGKSSRAYIRDIKQEGKVLAAGAKEIAVGDLGNERSLFKALDGIEAIYFIVPNVHQAEIQFGELAIKLSQKIDLKHFVYHSVIFPQIESMPHHWKKMRVEEMLIFSGLNFTILQPANYMQNMLAYRESIFNNGFFQIPYTLSAKSTPIDLLDLAEVAAKVIGDQKHFGASYPLAGPEVLSTLDQAKLIEDHLNKAVEAKVLDISIWISEAKKTGLREDAIDTLTHMFGYYEHSNFIGNPLILEMLLGRPPNRFEDFLQRDW